jgi:type II secretory ATPase GspE/PulE/Tfp pilus assembly ATPase PilB-like protein
LLKADLLYSSDIHLEPGPEHSRLRLRVDGSLRLVDEWTLSNEALEELIRHVKVLARLDTTIQKQPQEGSFAFRTQTTSIEARVSVLPIIGGAKLALRLQSNSFHRQTHMQGPESLSELGLDKEQIKTLDFALCLKQGAILVAGGTGSGKTTLLYAALRLLDSQSLNILTVEDPIEHQLEGVNQITISENLPRILPAILRQDPDVLMVGEMRCSQVASLALGAAISGSLVLSSVHASNCLEALTRLNDLGTTPAQMSASIRLIVSCRLLAKNCRNCLELTKVSIRFRDYFQISDTPVFQAQGCRECMKSGVAGRLGVYEFLPINQKMRRSILEMPTERFDGELLFDIASRQGYQPLTSKIRKLLLDGVVSPREVCKTLGLSPRVFK